MRRSPTLAAFLSFLWPGLGQWYVGSARTAVLFALPVAAVLGVLLIQARDGLADMAVSLINPSSALTLLILIGLMGLWRLIAMTDALVTAGRGRTWRRSGTLAAFGAMVLIVVMVHASVGAIAWSVYSAGSAIFVSEPGPDSTPGPSASSDIDGGFVFPPLATPDTRQSRINFLLTGIDSSETRDHALTDTLLVVSVDPETGKVAMVSFPRDIARFELYDGRTFRGKINSLMTYAQNHKQEFPDGGFPTLVKELGYLLGVPIHYYGAVDLAGFARMIDRVGGVTINNTTAINDPAYGGWTDGRPIGFRLTKGKHKLDGQEALAFVRSRMGVGGSDFARARRQQQLLIALQQKLTDPAMIPNLPGILDDAKGTVRTNFPADRLGEMLDLATAIDDKDIRRVVLNAPYSNHPPTNSTGGTYILKLDMKRLAGLSVELFGDESRYYVAPTPSPSGLPSSAPSPSAP